MNLKNELRNSKRRGIHSLADAVYDTEGAGGGFNQQSRICWVIPLIIFNAIIDYILFY